MSMDLCDQRDLSGPPSKVLVNNWQSPTTSKRMAFPCNLLVGRLLLPCEKLGSYDAEADYVQKVLTEVGNSFKDVIASLLAGSCGSIVLSLIVAFVSANLEWIQKAPCSTGVFDCTIFVFKSILM